METVYMQNKWLKIWHRFIQPRMDTNVDLLAANLLQKQHGDFDKIKLNLTNLIFQRKHLGDELSRIEKSMSRFDADSLNQDDLRERCRVLAATIDAINSDLRRARKVEQRLPKEIAATKALVKKLEGCKNNSRLRRLILVELRKLDKPTTNGAEEANKNSEKNQRKGGNKTRMVNRHLDIFERFNGDPVLL